MLQEIFFFLFCTNNTVSITLKRVSKRSSFRYAFQEHLLKFLMLAVTQSELLLRDHCTSRHFKLKTYNCSSIYQCYQPLYLPNIIFLALCFELFLNLRAKIEKNIVLYSFYKPFCRTCLFIALAAVCDKMVSYKTRITIIERYDLVYTINYKL
jgi:hypothetical protein